MPSGELSMGPLQAVWEPAAFFRSGFYIYIYYSFRGRLNGISPLAVLYRYPLLFGELVD